MARESEEITAARRHLGRQLAAWRARAGLTQRDLARRLGYSRSAVASAEAGQPAAAGFWTAADHAVGAGGRLAALDTAIQAAITAARQRAARQMWQARRAQAEAPDPALAPAAEHATLTAQDATCPRCDQPLIIAIRVTATLIPPIGLPLGTTLRGEQAGNLFPLAQLGATP